MHIKTDSLAPITQDEMIFIRTLADKEFKSTDLCENIRLKSKIYDICYKLRVSSFEEVLRKVLFYKLFKIDLSDEYLEHVEAYSREKISTLCTLRNTLLDAGKNVSEEFSDFCDISCLWDSGEFEDKIEECIEKVKSNVESHRMFNSVQSFINLVNVKHDFEQMFNIVFDLDDFEFQADAEKVAETFNSLSTKYIFIVKILINYSFPLNIKRKITPEEKDLIRFLLFKGDEIDYMRQYNISPLIFKDKLNSIISAYDCENLQELLLKANLEQTLSDASLLAQAIPLHIKSENYLNRKNKIIELTEDSCKIHVEQLLEQVDNLRNKNFVVGKDLLMEYLKTFENVADHYYSINGKTDTIKNWFEENVLPLDKVQQLLYSVSELETFIPYDSILDDYNGDE